ncbi:MAG: family 10 glycosylhydrolase [Chloroflexota bacterium]
MTKVIALWISLLFFVYLPIVVQPEPPPPPEPLVELRGLWISRFDWTVFGEPAAPAKIDEIVHNAATAGFNVLFFQVRGTADAFYDSPLEPWAVRVSGQNLGQPPDPYWDPLAYLIEQAHARGLQVHAYLNVYPVWSGCAVLPDPNAQPQHFYYQLRDHHGLTDDRLNGMQWNQAGEQLCIPYQYATPASVFVDDHLLAVAGDLVTRYAIDGLHLDHIRYGDRDTSCDPVSQAAFGADCFGQPGYAAWQRAQVNGTVAKIYQEVKSLAPDVWVSAAVWPIYIEQPAWGWGQWARQGYHDYYQDSKAWLANGTMDSISPMIYPSLFNCPDNSFWSLDKFETLVADFEADSHGRFVIPGIGTGYCTFDEIEARIATARQAGTAGHALFAYSGLLVNGYFDDLKNGPYAETAVVPSLP